MTACEIRCTGEDVASSSGRLVVSVLFRSCADLPPGRASVGDETHLQPAEALVSDCGHTVTARLDQTAPPAFGPRGQPVSPRNQERDGAVPP